MDVLDILLIASTGKDKTILKDNFSLGTFFLSSYSEFWLEVSVLEFWGYTSTNVCSVFVLPFLIWDIWTPNGFSHARINTLLAAQII